jgi:CcmD family protein
MRFIRALICAVCLAMPAISGAQPSPQQPQPAQSEFVPLSEVPPSEQIPAFRLVAIAYGFVWVLLLGYVWSVSQRLQKVERELSTIERRGA